MSFVTLRPSRGAKTEWGRGVRACRSWPPHETSCTMAPVLKGLASWHDEAPERASVSWRNLMLKRSAGGNRTGNPFGKLG